MISVVILTLNEEKDLPLCIDSVKWSDDVHILDSGSSDKTTEIARDFNTRLSIHRFESFGKQRNYAIDNLDVKNEWILFLDADEISTDTFHDAVLEAIKNANDSVAGFFCCWKMMLEGKWLKRCDNFPKWQLRLIKKGKARFTDFGHGQKESEILGEIRYIKEPYLHFGFSKGWHHWIQRHNKYSDQEALVRLNNLQPFKNIFSSHGSIRNPALKTWLSKVPGWPVLRFLYTYFLKLGFLEGMPGLIYCINMGYYEFLIQIKMREMRRTIIQQKSFI
jgi:glycosyltransferase involved in cell wall biosynthesis